MQARSCRHGAGEMKVQAWHVAAAEAGGGARTCAALISLCVMYVFFTRSSFSGCGVRIERTVVTIGPCSPQITICMRRGVVSARCLQHQRVPHHAAQRRHKQQFNKRTGVPPKGQAASEQPRDYDSAA
jgi:hypothetical protein